MLPLRRIRGASVTTWTPAEFAAHLATAGKRLDPIVGRTVNRAAMKIKEDWRRRAAEKNPPGSASAKYPSTIVQRKARVENGWHVAEVETLPRGQGKLGVILEYGGASNAPQRSNVAAAEAEAPELAKWLAKAAAEVI